MKLRLRTAVLAGAALFAVPILAIAAGNWSTLPMIGGAAYCASTVSGVGLPSGQGPFGVVPGSTQGSGSQGICAQTVPAGPATFAGTEVVPADIGPPGSTTGTSPSTALISIVQFGQGAMVDLTTVGTAQTIPNNTPWYFLDGAQGSALTVTMPAVAVEGQIQRVTCEAATVGTLTVAANTGQTLKGNPNTACVAGTNYSWRYAAATTTWYRY